jgi:hypothetical protein
MVDVRHGKSAQRQQLVSVKGVTGYFASKQGGDQQSNTSKVYDGGSLVAEVMSAPPEISNITVSRAYDLDRDQPVLENLRTQVGSWVTDITVSFTDRQFSVVGKTITYPNVLLVSIKEPEFSASSADATTYSLEFACTTMQSA